MCSRPKGKCTQEIVVDRAKRISPSARDRAQSSAAVRREPVPVGKGREATTGRQALSTSVDPAAQRPNTTTTTLPTNGPGLAGQWSSSWRKALYYIPRGPGKTAGKHTEDESTSGLSAGRAPGPLRAPSLGVGCEGRPAGTAPAAGTRGCEPSGGHGGK